MFSSFLIWSKNESEKHKKQIRLESFLPFLFCPALIQTSQIESYVSNEVVTFISLIGVKVAVEKMVMTSVRVRN